MNDIINTQMTKALVVQPESNKIYIEPIINQFKSFEYSNQLLQDAIKVNLSNVINQTNTFTNAMVNVLLEVDQTVKYLSTNLQNHLNLENINENFIKVGKGLIETEEEIKVFKSVMVKMGYPPHDFIDIRQMRYIAKNYNDNSDEAKNYIDQFMTEYYTPELMKEILSLWEETKFLHKRLPLLRNAMMAYNIGMYDLIVPAILSQLEGIIVEAFNFKGKVNGKILSILLKYLLLKNHNFQSAFNFDDAIHEYYSNQILENFEHGKQMKTDVSRHAILHGADTQFGKKTISLKVILLFDYITESIIDLKPETITTAKKEIKYVSRRKNSRKK